MKREEESARVPAGDKQAEEDLWQCHTRVIADVNRTLKGWNAYFKQVHPNVMKETDSWIRMRLRSILRGRAGRRGRSRKRDNIEWDNHHFNEHGLFSLLAARELEIANLRQGANL